MKQSQLQGFLLPPNSPNLRRKEGSNKVYRTIVSLEQTLCRLSLANSKYMTTNTGLPALRYNTNNRGCHVRLCGHTGLFSHSKVNSQPKCWAGGAFLIIFTAYCVKSNLPAGNFSFTLLQTVFVIYDTYTMPYQGCRTPFEFWQAQSLHSPLYRRAGYFTYRMHWNRVNQKDNKDSCVPEYDAI